MEIQWPLILFSFLAGTGGALMACVAMGEVRKVGKETNSLASLVALACIIVGGLASVVHLAHPANVMAAVTNLGSFSGISLELIFLALTGAATLVYVVMAVRNLGGEGAKRGVAIVAGVLGVVLSYICGHGYVIVAQPAWDTELIALAYAGTALACAAFVYAAVAVSKKESETVDPAVGILYMVFGVIGFVTVAAYVAIVGSMAFSIAAGTAIVAVVAAAGAMVCGIMMSRKPAANLVWAGLVCSIIAGLALRVLMWQLGVGSIDFFTVAANSPVMLNLR